MLQRRHLHASEVALVVKFGAYTVIFKNILYLKMYLQCIYVYCMNICNERKKTKLVCGGSLLDCCLLLAPAQPLSYQIDLRDQQIAGEAFCQEI